MNLSIKRLLGALLLAGTLGVSAVMAVRANAHNLPSVSDGVAPLSSTGEHLDG